MTDTRLTSRPDHTRIAVLNPMARLVAPVTDRTGIVLVQEGSDGFGDQHPALLALDGRPVVCHVVDALAAVASGVVVACPPAGRVSVDTALGDRTAPLVTPTGGDGGPLTCFGTALDAVDTELVALVDGRMPAVDPDFLGFLFERIGANEAAVPRLPDGDRQPAQAVYRSAPTRAAAAAAVADDRTSLAAVIDRLQALVLSPTEVQQRTRWRSLRQVASPADLAAFESDG